MSYFHQLVLISALAWIFPSESYLLSPSATLLNKAAGRNFGVKFTENIGKSGIRSLPKRQFTMSSLSGGGQFLLSLNEVCIEVKLTS
jgi:hypothetical protein